MYLLVLSVLQLFITSNLLPRIVVQGVLIEMISARPWRTRLSLHCVLVLSLLVMAWPVSIASAQTSKPNGPTQVEVGVWFSGIHNIDFVNGSFGAEFYMWWISPNPDFRPFDVFQVLNGRGWNVRAIDQRTLPDGMLHTSGIVSVTVNHDWQLSHFPFDRQSLRVIIETSHTASELKLVPNTSQSIISDFMQVEGFEVLGLKLEEKVEKYATDFGIKGASGDQFSRLVMTIELKRESGRLVVAMLIGFIVANIIVLMTYAIHVSALSIRASMVGSAIFGAIGNMYSLNAVLNPAVGSLLVDRFAVGTFAMIVIALLNSIVVERLATKGRSSLAHKFNRSAFYVAFGTAIVYYTLAFVLALQATD
jgi:hypothetical protein